MINLLEDYIENFFHWDYGAFYSQHVVAANESALKKLFFQIKFSIG